MPGMPGTVAARHNHPSLHGVRRPAFLTQGNHGASYSEGRTMTSARQPEAGAVEEKILSALRRGTAAALLLLSACGDHGGSEGNVVEKMAIFSLISLSVFALISISFSGGKEKGSVPDDVSASPLTDSILTAGTVYACGPSSSFRKMKFAPDGTFLSSPSMTARGPDPDVTPAGTWKVTFDGAVRLFLTSPETTVTYSRTGRDTATEGMRMVTDSGIAETWHFGPTGLSRAQVACFGPLEPAPPADPREEAEPGSLGKGREP